MNKTLLGLVFAIVLAGCDTVEGMRDTIDTKEQLKGLIEEAIGVEAQVGFTINNGVLIDVSFAMNATAVANRSVLELERIARSVVKKTFEEKPRAIYIQLVTSAE